MASEVHTLPYADGWINQQSEDREIVSMHASQAEAVFVGREIARRSGCEHFIHAGPMIHPGPMCNPSGGVQSMTGSAPRLQARG
jgi:hypothetical protein